MRNLFVSGTDTDVGKTFVSSLLCHHFSKHTKVKYFKPVQAGVPTDYDRVKNLCDNVETLLPVYDLIRPASPNRSASAENIEIEISEIEKVWNIRESCFHLVEGAGGLLVPLNSKQKVIDLLRSMKIPTLLVSSTRLGTINHTLLSIEALKARNIECVGIVLNGEPDPGLKELLEEQSGVSVLFEIKPQETESVEVFEKCLEDSEELRGFIDSWMSGDLFSLNSAEDTKPLLGLDKKHVWHPFTQHGIVKNHPLVEGANGSYLNIEGRKVIDAISSWWVNLLGHNHPSIVRAVQNQVEKLDHVIFAGFTHEPAVKLSKKLIELCQERDADLRKVFFSDNGSTAVEVALKMAFQFHQQKGNKKKSRFLAFKGSYHGDTLGAMSVGERGGFNKVFDPMLFDVDFIDPFSNDDLERAFEKRGEQYAGVIFEPMVQGASGMRMYGAEVLNRLQTLCDKYDVFKISDEVFTGFYRTGCCFAFEHSSLKPDFLCLSKGLTGGSLPLAVTITSNNVFEVFNNSDMRQAFLHGHSYTANPIACAAANATIDELLKPATLKKIQQVSEWTKDIVNEMSQKSGVFHARSLGTIGALEVRDEDPNYFKGDYSYRFNQRALKRGVLLRPLGGTLYTVPPYCIEKHELLKAYDVMWNTLKEEL